jgi:CRP/FNR family transcriptional regulator, cyclic AMP receptor protein
MKSILRQLFQPKVVCQHAELLHKLRLFHTLTYRELSFVELILHERIYQEDEVIFEEGEQGLGMYIILEGKVKVVRRGALRKVLGKQEIAVLEEGESFGELALLSSDSKRSATVIAATQTRLLSMFQPEFLRLLESHDRLGAKLSFELACSMADKFRRSIENDSFDETI